MKNKKRDRIGGGSRAGGDGAADDSFCIKER